MPRKGQRCAPDCKCGLHFRTEQHEARRVIALRLTGEATNWAAQKQNLTKTPTWRGRE